MCGTLHSNHVSASEPHKFDINADIRPVLITYSSKLDTFAHSVIKRLQLSDGMPVTINDLASQYSYDVMTQLAFGEVGGFVDGTSSDTSNDVLNGIQTAFDAIGLLSHVPWMMSLLTNFSFLPGPLKAVNDWSNKAVNQRKKV